MFVSPATISARPLQLMRRGRGVPARASSPSGPSSVPSQLFQLPNRPATHTTLEDIQDAYEVCSLIPAPGERAQCYTVFGLDHSKMESYYEVVLGLEGRLGRQPAFLDRPSTGDALALSSFE